MINDNVIINIKTRNVNRLLNNIYKLNINIYKVDIINYKEVNIEININDLEKIKKISVLNEINIINYRGKTKIKRNIIYNKILLFSLFIGLIILIILTNIIFNIEVVHSNSKLRNYVYNELNKYGIHEYQFVKSFDKLEEIKNKIINNNKDKIEWLEIERVGTKYIVKFEERIINNIDNDFIYQDIIATHDGIVKKIVATNGVIVKSNNDYVSKGDTLISGSIYLNDELKGYTKAMGNVYAEVWYKLSVTYPLINDTKEETGKFYKTYSLNFFNKKISLMNKYKNSYVKSEEKIFNNIIPISISKDTIYELNNVNGIYTEGESLMHAKDYAKEKMKEKLKEDEYIIQDKVLKYGSNRNTIYIDIFYKVYANITGVKKIEEIKEGE